MTHWEGYLQAQRLHFALVALLTQSFRAYQYNHGSFAIVQRHRGLVQQSRKRVARRINQTGY